MKHKIEHYYDELMVINAGSKWTDPVFNRVSKNLFRVSLTDFEDVSTGDAFIEIFRVYRMDGKFFFYFVVPREMVKGDELHDKKKPSGSTTHFSDPDANPLTASLSEFHEDLADNLAEHLHKNDHHEKD